MNRQIPRAGIAFLISCILAACAFAADTISAFGKMWTVPSQQDWKVTADHGEPMLQLLVGREPLPGPRRPFQFALLDMVDADIVTFEADVRPTKRSLIIVYAYRDQAHFNYLHMSTDTGTKQPVHNGVFHVYGGERVRISDPAGVASFSAVNRWYRIRVAWEGATGAVQGYVDGAPIPALRAVDLSLRQGRMGIGSFDETADFKNVRISAH